MIGNRMVFRPNGFRLAGRWVLQAVALALLLSLSIPAGAADQRAVLSRVAPVYPELAKRMKISGEIQVALTIDASGKVTGTKTVHGPRMLSQVAENAVAKWKFEPGDSVSTVVVSITFNSVQ